MLKYLGFALIGMTISAGTANAVTIYASSPVYAGQSGGSTVTCRVFNAGAEAATVTDRRLIDNTGASQSLSQSNCLATLSSGQTCTYSAASPGNVSFVCRLIVSGNKSFLTGIAEINKSGVYSTQAIVRSP